MKTPDTSKEKYWIIVAALSFVTLISTLTTLVMTMLWVFRFPVSSPFVMGTLTSAFALALSLMTSAAMMHYASLLRDNRYLQERAKARIAATDINVYAESENKRNEELLRAVSEAQERGSDQLMTLLQRRLDQVGVLSTQIQKMFNNFNVTFDKRVQQIDIRMENIEKKLDWGDEGVMGGTPPSVANTSSVSEDSGYYDETGGESSYSEGFPDDDH